MMEGKRTKGYKRMAEVFLRSEQILTWRQQRNCRGMWTIAWFRDNFVALHQGGHAEKGLSAEELQAKKQSKYQQVLTA